MNIKINDKPYEIEAGSNLTTLMELLGQKPQGIAVAINYEVIPKDQWEKTVLTENMELVLIQAVSGG